MPEKYDQESVEPILNIFRNPQKYDPRQLTKLNLNQTMISKILRKSPVINYIPPETYIPENKQESKTLAAFDYHNVIDSDIENIYQLFRELKEKQYKIIIISHVSYQKTTYYSVLLGCFVSILAPLIDEVHLVFSKTDYFESKAKILSDLSKKYDKIIFSDDSWINCELICKHCPRVRLIHYLGGLKNTYDEKKLHQMSKYKNKVKSINNITDLANIYLNFYNHTTLIFLIRIFFFSIFKPSLSFWFN